VPARSEVKLAFSVPANTAERFVVKPTVVPSSVIEASPIAWAPVNLARVFVVPPDVVTPEPDPESDRQEFPESADSGLRRERYQYR